MRLTDPRADARRRLGAIARWPDFYGRRHAPDPLTRARRRAVVARGRRRPAAPRRVGERHGRALPRAPRARQRRRRRGRGARDGREPRAPGARARGWRERCGEPRSLQLAARAGQRLRRFASPDGASARRRESAPRARRVHELPVLRPDRRVAVERAEAHRDLGVGERVAAEQRRAAVRAEQLRYARRRPERAQPLLALQEPEAALRHAPVRRGAGAGAPLAACAVAVAGRQERRGDLEAHRAAQASALERRRREGGSGAGADARTRSSS